MRWRMKVPQTWIYRVSNPGPRGLKSSVLPLGQAMLNVTLSRYFYCKSVLSTYTFGIKNVVIMIEPTTSGMWYNFILKHYDLRNKLNLEPLENAPCINRLTYPRPTQLICTYLCTVCGETRRQRWQTAESPQSAWGRWRPGRKSEPTLLWRNRIARNNIRWVY